jgi:protein phosphatase
MRLPTTPVDSEQAAPTTVAPDAEFRVTSHGLTDPGRVRQRNEDQFLIAALAHALQVRESSVDPPDVKYGGSQGHLFVVADGMGGHAGGQQASALAVNSIETFLLDAVNWCSRLRGQGDAILGEFQKALEEADEKLLGEARRRPELHGMGTTATLAYAVHWRLFIAHVGDSRCYLLRNRLLYRLTRDHTLVEEMVQRGILKPEEAAAHRFRHVIANVLGGTDSGVKVELHKVPLEAGDRLLLCSDGLTEMVADEEIAAVLESARDPEEACRRLVDRANELGGKDNITVVAARFDG